MTLLSERGKKFDEATETQSKTNLLSENMSISIHLPNE